MSDHFWKYKHLTIYPFSSQSILQYDRTALHIIKMKINFVATAQRPKFFMARFANGSWAW